MTSIYAISREFRGISVTSTRLGVSGISRNAAQSLDLLAT